MQPLSNQVNEGNSGERERNGCGFKGYGEPNFVMLPREFVRHQMAGLSEAELKVMLYIFDHTWGYSDEEGNRKNADAISRSQFLYGIHRADGTIVDRGAGVSDRSLDRALNHLVEKGYIFRHRQVDPSGRSATNIYELNRTGEPQYRPELAQATTTHRESEEVASGAGQVPPAHSVLFDSRQLKTQTNCEGDPTPTTTPNSDPDPDPRKFTPLTHNRADSTPANLRPSTPANLRPSTPANLPQTIENHYQNKTQQINTALTTPTTPSKKKFTDRPGVGVKSSQDSLPKEKLPSGATSNRAKYASEKSESKSQALPTQENARVVPSGEVREETRLRQEFNEELIALQISREEARHLAALAIKNGHTEGYIKKALAYIERQAQIKNPTGFLIHLIKTNWQPPVVATGSGTGRDKKAFSRGLDLTKYTTGKYAFLTKSPQPATVGLLR